MIMDADRRVAGALLAMLENAWRSDGTGTYDAPMGYLQWAKFPEGIQIECVSNAFLESDDQLSFSQRRTLALCGWASPDAEVPNYYRRFEEFEELGAAALALAEVVRRVLSDGEPDSSGAYDLGALLEAARHARRAATLTDAYSVWLEDRAAAFVRAFDPACRGLDLILGLREAKGEALEQLFVTTLRRRDALSSPFAGYREAPMAVIELSQEHGDGLDAAVEALQRKLDQLLLTIMQRAWGIDRRTTMSDSDLMAVGWDPARPTPEDPLVDDEVW